MTQNDADLHQLTAGTNLRFVSRMPQADYFLKSMKLITFLAQVQRIFSAEEAPG